MGVGLVRKETGWLTNSRVLAHTLSQECSNKKGDQEWHRHVTLMGGGRAAKAAKYPMPLVRAVLTALRRELREAGEISNLEPGPSPHEPLIAPQEPAVAEELASYWDDVRGGWLNPALVGQARQDEVTEFQRYRVLDIVPRTQFEEHKERELAAGRKVKAIDTRWSDTNKGTAEAPEVRSRLCAREIKRLQELGITEMAGNASDLFASMPPIEAIRTVFSLFMSRRQSRAGKPLKVRLFDIKRAYFNAAAAREHLYIEVPEELIPAGVDPKDVIGILRKSMYGTRDAGANWEMEFTSCLVEAGFVQGMACPNIYVHSDLDVVCVCHGDDAHAVADEDGLDKLQAAMEARYEVKVRATLGSGPKDQRSATFLNRQVRLTDEDSLEMEADPRHALEIIRAMGLQNGKAVTTPIVKEPASTATEEQPPLDKSRAAVFRSSCMRAAYLSIDRYDLQYCAKEAAREMHCPSERGWGIMKRMARYLLGSPRLITTYTRQHMPHRLDIYTDSDHAGCLRTRKSTSSINVLHGTHCIKTVAATQSTIALSSPESEFYALTKGCSLAIGTQSMFRDMQVDHQLKVHCDASSGISLAHRRGLGRARHISTRYLWVQQKVLEKVLEITKVPGKSNPADVGTKCVSEREMSAALEKMGMKIALRMESSSALRCLECSRHGPVAVAGAAAAVESGLHRLD